MKKVNALRLKNISKKFAGEFAVNNVSLTVEPGKLFAVVGPSGCGKTTLLRMIAGLETPDSGCIVLGETQLYNTNPPVCVPPHRRRIGMVFQNYALWPHMTVFQNVAYPLRIRRVGRAEQHQIVTSALAQVRMDGYASRHPHQLSGGEQQRVALARALVMRPKILLLDEPLSNLDAHLREDMGREVRRIQQETGITIIYVTHDQAEAMTLADWIVVMDKSRVMQMGSPEDVYRKPQTQFVAGFIGVSNLVSCPIAGHNGDSKALLPGGGTIAVENLHNHNANGCATLSIRPEDIMVSRNGNGMPGKILDVAYQGNLVRYQLSSGGIDFKVQATSEECFKVGDNVRVRIRRATVVPEL